MQTTPQIRIALVAPSGSGKSTAAALLQKCFEQSGKRVEILKLATPLYALQQAFYQQACCALAPAGQDQHLLENIAKELRRIDPQCLVKNFAERLWASSADVIINDDLRDDTTDWPYLRQQGFDVLKIVTDDAIRTARLQRRADVSIVEKSPLDRQMQRIDADYAIPNNGSLDTLSVHIEAVSNWLQRHDHRVAA